MNKVKVSDAKLAASEIINEGKTGVRKCLGLLVNLWKRGAAGTCVLTACALLMSCLFSGCGAESDDLADASGNTESKVVSSQQGKQPSVKGLRLGMSPHEAIEACNKLIEGDSNLKLKQYSNGEIKIVHETVRSFNNVCHLWLKGEGEEEKVWAIEFPRFGLGLLFNSADLKGEELCRLLVKNYSWIGSMEPDVRYTGSGTTTTWKYMNPNGYKVIVKENVTAQEREMTFGLYAIATEASRKFD